MDSLQGEARLEVVRSSSYRADIDGLRAVAVGAVVLFHLFPDVVPGGFVGVDVFFVISGYLITGILLKERRFSIREFYSRRVRRIFPALSLVLGSCLCIGALLLLPEEFASLGKHTFAGAAFAANIALFRDVGYFDSASEAKPLLHLWSLGVEEQYYLVWPLLIAVLRRNSRLLLPGIAAIVVASGAWCVWATWSQPAAAFYLPFSRMWELAIGGALAAWSPSWDDKWNSRRARSLLAAGGGLALIAGVALLNRKLRFPGFWAALPVLGTAAIVAAGPQSGLAQRLLTRRSWVAVGLVSYPLYLWHWPLLAFARATVGQEISVWARVLLAAVAFALARATYRYVELPVRHRVRAAPSLGVVLGAIGFGGLVIYSARGVPERVRGAAVVVASPGQRGMCPPALQGGGRAALDVCAVNPTGSPVAAIVGDSHAGQYLPVVGELEGPWLIAAHYSCPPVLGVEVTADQPNCAEKAERVLSYLGSREAASIRVVVLAWYFGYSRSDAFAADHVANHTGPPIVRVNGAADPARKQALLEEGLLRYVEAVIAAGKSVAVLTDVPEFPFRPSRCAPDLPVRSAVVKLLDPTLTCAVPLALTLERRRGYAASLSRLKQAHPDVRVVDSLGELCDVRECSVLRDQKLLYRDSHHLSAAGAALLLPKLEGVAGPRD